MIKDLIGRNIDIDSKDINKTETNKAQSNKGIIYHLTVKISQNKNRPQNGKQKIQDHTHTNQNQYI